MRIMIVDDDEVFAEEIAAFIRGENRRNRYTFEVICYQNGRAFCAALDEGQAADVYLLDIEIGDMSGLELAQRIRMADKKGWLVFLTSHEEYALSGYEYGAYRYLVKEGWKKRLPQVLAAIWEDAGKREGRVYRIQSERRYDTIDLDDILYIEKVEKNTYFYCRGGQSYQERCTLGEVYKKLPQEEFVYINRGQIVNIRHITHLDSQAVELEEKVRLILSKTMLGDIRSKLLKYWRK